jgi:membrane fusion protein (multidrug efflux system)
VAKVVLKDRETEPVPRIAERVPEAAPPSAPAARSGGKRKLLIVLGLVALGVGVFGTRAVIAQGKESTDDAQIDADIVAVAPEVGGRVARVLVHDNQVVKRGDVLLEIEVQEYAAMQESARAAVATAAAEVRSAQAHELIVAASAHGSLNSAKAALSGSAVNVSSVDSQIAAAEASVARAKADAEKASLELSRSQSLFDQQSIAKEALDNSRLAADSAQASLNRANAELRSAQDAKRFAQSQVAEARGRLAQSTPVEAQIAAAAADSELAAAHLQAAQAKLALADLDVNRTQVKAATDGFVSRLTARPGQLLAPNQPVAELVPIETYVIANFKETQLPGITPGKAAEIDVDAYPGHPLHGVVESLSGGTGARFSLLPPDNASGNFVKVVQRVPVRIAIKDAPADLPLRAGLSAEVTVLTQ